MRRRRLPLRLRALALARAGGGLPHREEREPGAEDAAAHDDALHEPRAYALEDDGDGGATAEDIAETFGTSNVREDRAEIKAWRERVGEAQSKHDVREVQYRCLNSEAELTDREFAEWCTRMAACCVR